MLKINLLNSFSGGSFGRWLDVNIPLSTVWPISLMKYVFSGMTMKMGKVIIGIGVKRKVITHFTTPKKLLADFQLDIERWNHENSDS